MLNVLHLIYEYTEANLRLAIIPIEWYSLVEDIIGLLYIPDKSLWEALK